eukprot:5924141-Pyramimonas_sp.AAC.1
MAPGSLTSSRTQVDEPTDRPHGEVMGHKDDLQGGGQLLIGGDPFGVAKTGDPQLRRIGWSCRVIQVLREPAFNVKLLYSRG